MNNNQDTRKIFYGVIGIAVLVVSVVGATFAYFTASASNDNKIGGNFANINFSLSVTKVTEAGDSSGLIPMTNGQVDTAISAANTTSNGICMDDNGNAVCQIYKVVVSNSSTATMMVDGYVRISGGPGVAHTLETVDPSKDKFYVSDTVESRTVNGDNITYNYLKDGNDANILALTGMRWAQAFCTGADNALTGCTTNGDVYLAADQSANGKVTMAVLATTTDTLKNQSKIFTKRTQVSGSATIDGNSYETVGNNFIRISQSTDTTFTRSEDYTSALVWSQQLAANGTTITIDNKTINTDEATYYFVVWLSESGYTQNVSPSAPASFTGNVTFISAQGSEVTSTFSSAAKITSDVANN